MSQPRVNFRTVTWLSEVLKADPEHYEPDIAYEFSNDRKFLNTDKSKTTGIYGYGYIAGDDDFILVGDDDVEIMGD